LALTTLQKVKIVSDLGYPAKAVYPDSILYINWVDDRISNLEADIETCVLDLLARLAKMDEALEKAICRVGLMKVDNVTFKGKDEELRALRKERFRLLNELADLLDIPNQTGGNMARVSV
jgi:uncharacterized protein YdcH (DUF465 family)